MSADIGSVGISTRGSSYVDTECSGDSGASWILSSGSGEAGPEAGEAGVVGRLLEDGDWYPGEDIWSGLAGVSRGVCWGEDWVSGDMGDSAILRGGGESGPGGESQEGRGAGGSDEDN